MQYLVQIGTKNDHTQGSAVEHETTAYVYQPNGRCVGTLAVEVLHNLRQLYEQAKIDNPDLHECSGSTFEQDVAQLLLRYNDSYTDKAHKPTHMKNQWTCPDHLMHTLAATGPISERFASPLDKHALSHTYWSTFSADQLFGARHDAYSLPWVGRSQAHPGCMPADTEKAVRWAISSAQAYPLTPTCTIMVLPNTPGDPHMRYLNHPF
jgi:DNA-binding ferritin-like protein (Dps family)